ncbi:hypothetical protein [Streptomyces sp. JV178]|nr:hypothetical protein [Streptomyces sp. JV178]
MAVLRAAARCRSARRRALLERITRTAARVRKLDDLADEVEAAE